MHAIQGADAEFLEAVAVDLQRHIGRGGAVEGIALEHTAGGVAIVASVRVGHQTIALRGSGVNILTAYAELRRAAPEPILVSAFEQVLGV
jgi:hypothetical protein